jgi:hypothetical protein
MSEIDLLHARGNGPVREGLEIKAYDIRVGRKKIRQTLQGLSLVRSGNLLLTIIYRHSTTLP